jgi:hypothetical protein
MEARTRRADAARRPGAAAATVPRLLLLLLAAAPWRRKGDATAARREGAIGEEEEAGGGAGKVVAEEEGFCSAAWFSGEEMGMFSYLVSFRRRKTATQDATDGLPFFSMLPRRGLTGRPVAIVH